MSEWRRRKESNGEKRIRKRSRREKVSREGEKQGGEMDQRAKWSGGVGKSEASVGGKHETKTCAKRGDKEQNDAGVNNRETKVRL